MAEDFSQGIPQSETEMSSKKRAPVPKPGALEGVLQYKKFDAIPSRTFLFGEGSIDYYPDSDTVNITPVIGGKSRLYNLRTKAFVYGRDALPDEIPAVDKSAQDAQEALRRYGIDVDAIPAGYPEVDTLIETVAASDDRLTVSDLLTQKREGAWLVQQTTHDGYEPEYMLFQFKDAKVKEGNDKYHKYSLHKVPLSNIVGEDPSYDLELKTQFGRYPLRFAANFYEGPGYVNGDEVDSVSFYPIDEEVAKKLLNLRIPDTDSSKGQEPYYREREVLTNSLRALQFMRWSKWEGVNPRDADISLEDMNHEAYAGAITSLVERFGEEFFQDVSWEILINNLERIHTPEMTDPPARHKPHADAFTFHHEEIEAARVVVDNRHPMPEYLFKGVINVLPLYGDVDFWNVLSERYPETFSELTNRWLSLPDAYTKQNEKMVTRYKDTILHPRAILRDLFPEAYAFLSERDERFTPPTDSVAVKIIGDTA